MSARAVLPMPDDSEADLARPLSLGDLEPEPYFSRAVAEAVKAP
jgi:hypothetical protein